MIATRRLCEALHLGALRPQELKHLSIALAEATTGEVVQNPAFAERVLIIYRELAASRKPSSAGDRRVRKASAKPTLTPINYVDPKLFGPDRPLDPYLLQYAYGDNQLQPALERYPAGELKKAAAIVEQRNPGTRPSNRAQKRALIDYIMSCVQRAS